MVFYGIIRKQPLNNLLIMNDLPLNNENPPPTGELPLSSGPTGPLRSIMKRVGAALGILNQNREAASLRDHHIEAFSDLKTMIAELAEVKEEIEGSANDELRPHILAIINPMLRQLRRLQGQADAGKLDPNSSWLSKAKTWQQLRGKPSNRSTVIRSLIEHVKEEVEKSILQDLHVIQVYLHHRMDMLRLPHTDRKKVEATLHTKLRLIGDTMRSLALAPALGSIKALGAWRREVNRQRQKHQEAALELIDKHLAD